MNIHVNIRNLNVMKHSRNHSICVSIDNVVLVHNAVNATIERNDKKLVTTFNLNRTTISLVFNCSC